MQGYKTFLIDSYIWDSVNQKFMKEYCDHMIYTTVSKQDYISLCTTVNLYFDIEIDLQQLDCLPHAGERNYAEA